MHCIKLLSETKASVVVTITYSWGNDTVYFKDFVGNGNDFMPVTTICQTLPIGWNNIKIDNVKLQQDSSNSNVWKSLGILVQDVPGGILLMNI